MNDIQELIPVDWFDGLVLAPEHLVHSDKRLEAFVAHVLQVVHRPGVLVSPCERATPSQLVRLHSSSKGTQGFSVELATARSAVLIAPSGRVVILVGPSTGAERTQPHVITLPDSTPEERLVVLASHMGQHQDHPHGKSVKDRQIDLRWPEIRFDVVGMHTYEEHLHDRYSQGVVVGGLLFAANAQQITADLRFIPPLTSLRGAAFFDEGAIARLRDSFNDLISFVTGNIERLVGAMDVRDATGQGRRRADYELLRMLLVANIGRVQNLDDYAPHQFCSEIMQPLAKWWLDFKDHAFPGSLTPQLEQMTASAQRVEQLNWTRLCAGTRVLLDESQTLLDGMKEFMRYVT